MSIIAKKQSNFIPPPEGVWPAVAVDVVDLGNVTDMWGTKHKIRIVWEISEKMADGKPYIAAKTYTLSLHERASLAKDLKNMRGRAFTKEELEGFDVEILAEKNVPCQLVITHVEKDDVTYGNITAITKANPYSKLLPSGQYVRAKDRPENQIASNRQMMDSSGFQEDVKQLNNPEYGEVEQEDDVPF